MNRALCRRCQKPHGGDGRRSYCLACRTVIRRESLRKAAKKYAHSEKGRAARSRHRRSETYRKYARENRERIRAWHRRHANSEKGRAQRRGWRARRYVYVKNYQQAYWEANRERILARRKELRALRWPHIGTCRAAPCRGTFLVGPKQGRKAYCDTCISAFYGPSRLKARAA